jgi:hypothetical protein
VEGPRLFPLDHIAVRILELNEQIAVGVPVPERLLHLMQRLLRRRCVLGFPSLFLDECDLVRDALFEVGNVDSQPAEFFVLIERRAVRPEGLAVEIFKLEHISA